MHIWFCCLGHVEELDVNAIFQNCSCLSGEWYRQNIRMNDKSVEFLLRPPLSEQIYRAYKRCNRDRWYIKCIRDIFIPLLFESCTLYNELEMHRSVIMKENNQLESTHLSWWLLIISPRCI